MRESIAKLVSANEMTDKQLIDEIMHTIERLKKKTCDSNEDRYTIYVGGYIWYTLNDYKYIMHDYCSRITKHLLYGHEIKHNEMLQPYEIRIIYEGRDYDMAPDYRRFYYGIRNKDKEKLPRKVVINKKKKATTLLWEDDEATVVKKSKDDKEDYEKAFLWGYFLKQSGLSKTQANKYIQKIMEEE